MTTPLIELMEVDSTSTYAAQLLRQGQVAPFAVRADRQTGGRGRRGQVWQSPVGNLYLTLVLPPEPIPIGKWSAVQGLLPLKAAVIVARCLQRVAHVRTTLKWPNDILFAGRKLGGLLLEGSIKGNEPGEVLIGIGINLAKAPTLAASAGYQAVSLQEIIGRSLSVADVASALLQQFADEWSAMSQSSVIGAYAEFAIENGQLWSQRFLDSNELAQLSSRGLPQLCRAQEICSDGRFVLAPLEGQGQPIMLVSAEHSYGWIYQGNQRSMQELEVSQDRPVLLADIGNTAIKLAAYTSAQAVEPIEVISVLHGGAEQELVAALTRIAAYSKFSNWPLFYISVNPTASERLKELAKLSGLAAQVIPKRPLRRFGKGYRFNELGGDRLAGIEGLLARHKADRRGGRTRASVLVNCGTATTIDVILDDGEHLGGLIAPGMETSLTALHHSTALLPKVSMREGDASVYTTLASGTELALVQGSLFAMIGAVRQAVAVALAQHYYIRNIDFILTGGFAVHLAPAFPEAEVVPNLVLAGAMAMVVGGRLADSTESD